MAKHKPGAYDRLLAFIQYARTARPAPIDSFCGAVASAVISYLHFACDKPEDADQQARAVRSLLQKAEDIDLLQKHVAELFAPLQEMARQTDGKSLPVRKAIEYMERHHAERLTLAEIAEQAGFSPEHFSRVFRRETGVNYVAYLNNLRMKDPLQLLEQSDSKVYEIAEKVGFSSLSYFSTTFKKKFGKSPYEYQIDHQRSQ